MIAWIMNRVNAFFLNYKFTIMFACCWAVVFCCIVLVVLPAVGCCCHSRLHYKGLVVVVYCCLLMSVVIVASIRLHYKEYLVRLINSHRIDPVTIMTTKDIILLLQRVDLPIPQKQCKESESRYHDKLCKVCEEHFPQRFSHAEIV